MSLRGKDGFLFTVSELTSDFSLVLVLLMFPSQGLEGHRWAAMSVLRPTGMLRGEDLARHSQDLSLCLAGRALSYLFLRTQILCQRVLWSGCSVGSEGVVVLKAPLWS